MERRAFLKTSMAGGAIAVSSIRRVQAQSSGNEVVVGVMGLSRGKSLAVSFARQAGCRVKYVCDVDQRRIESCQQELSAAGGDSPQGVADFRRILDDPDVDALVCATPNHWHGPATILACQAGKHVYVEKPCSHTPQEGEGMVAAARRHRRVVQLGTQRRSSPGTIEAMARLHSGDIGRVYLARSWYNNVRGSIGVGKPAAVPANLDFELWQGPAPRRPYIDNLVHYNWHWRWHWGNGELGNNGIHTLDLCRWGLGVDYPAAVTSSGGRYHYDDDQETPDTHTVCFDFSSGQSITWQGLSCNRHESGTFVTFYGTDGTLELPANGNYVIFDRNDKVVDRKEGSSGGDREHILNFLDAVRSGERQQLNAEIQEGHKSTLLCHLGNIAHRTARRLECDTANGHVLNDKVAQELWQREYEPAWQPDFQA